MATPADSRRWAWYAMFRRGPESPSLPRPNAPHPPADDADALRALLAKRTQFWELIGVPDLAGAAVVLGWFDEDEAWEQVAEAARKIQRLYGSWAELGEGYRQYIADISDGRGSGDWEARELLERVSVPWNLDLGTPRPRVRFLRATCAACGAATTRPSPTAYVYCDLCAALVGLDFERARAAGLPQPGPAYEALRAELAPLLAASAIHDFRRAQVQLFEAWVDACPAAVPIRVRDPAYRTRYVAWLAEGATRGAFDAASRVLEAAMTATIGALAFEARDGGVRVAIAPFRAMCDAVFALEARRDELYAATGVYAMQPDGASRELQRALGNSLFAQGWVPYLDAPDAAELLARCGIELAYVEALAPATRDASCEHCGAELAVLPAARRVVCGDCGRIATLAPP